MLFYIDVTAPVNVQVIITGKCKMEHANFFEYICIIIIFFKGGGDKDHVFKVCWNWMPRKQPTPSISVIHPCYSLGTMKNGDHTTSPNLINNQGHEP